MLTFFFFFLVYNRKILLKSFFFNKREIFNVAKEPKSKDTEFFFFFHAFREFTLRTSRTGTDDLLIYLGKQFRKADADIVVRLNRHPYWRTVPLIQVDETLQFLLNNNFTKEDIYKSIHIVLYPRYVFFHPLLLKHKKNVPLLGDNFLIGRMKSDQKHR